MNCRKAQQWILLEQSGELGSSRRPALQEHLASCSACRTWRDADLAGALAAARVLPMPEPDDRLVRAVVERMPACGPTRWTALWRPLIACAASLAVMLCAWQFVVRTPKTLSPAQAQSQRIDETHALASLLSEDDATSTVSMSDESSPEAKLRVLADQLLILQGLAPEDSTTDESTATPTDGNQPTVLRERSSRAIRSEKCV